MLDPSSFTISKMDYVGNFENFLSERRMIAFLFLVWRTRAASQI